MKISTKILIIAASAAICLSVASCKKDPETTTSKSFTTGPQFDLPSFVLPGEVIECVPTGVSREDGDEGDWGYYWTINPLDKTKDTTKVEGKPGDGRFKFTVKDTLCDVTVMCVAFAEGYYTSSASHVMTIVKPGYGGSITDDDINPRTPRMFDERDGKSYPFTEVGDLQWFARNLAYEGLAYPFDNADAMTDVFGLYYDWNNASDACPDGWRLPTKNDWDNLAKALGAGVTAEGSLDYADIAGDMMVDAYFNGIRMWEYWPDVKITNKSGFSALPTGIATKSSNSPASFSNVLSYGAWWTAEEIDEEKAVYRYINVNQPHVYAGYGYKENMLLPVRCVREK